MMGANEFYQYAAGKPNGTRGESNLPLPEIRLKLFRDLAKPLPKPWIIKNVMALGEISSWIAPPGKGKSSLLTDIAVHLAAGLNWRGYRTKIRRGVVYFALERAALVERRLHAYGLRDGFEDLPIAVAGQVIDLMNKSCVVQIMDAIKRAEDAFGIKVALGVFDTHSKGIAAGGGDENHARDQNIVAANMRRVLDQTEIHLASIGHTGKDVNKGERGSNARLADVDAEVQISGDTVKTATVTKANDQPEGQLTGFQLEPYEFEADEDGDKFKTYIVSKEILAGQTAGKRLTDQQVLAMAALTEVLLSDKAKLAPPGYELRKGTKVAPYEKWVEEMGRNGAIDKNKPGHRSSLQNIRAKLQRDKVIGFRDELVWDAR